MPNVCPGIFKTGWTMRVANLIGAALAAALCCISTTQATPIATLVYTGTVSDTFNGANSLFPNVAIGNSWTATYVFDLGIGSMQTGPGFQFLFGGTNDGAPSPLVSATLDIQGVSQTLLGGFHDGISVDNFIASSSEYVATAQFTSAALNTQLFDKIIAAPPAWTYLIQPLDYTLDAGDSSVGIVIFNKPGSFSTIGANLTHLTATITDTVAVPEPLTASLFGMGLLGLGLMRRRQSPRVRCSFIASCIAMGNGRLS
jgi:hypothetical protein